MSRSVDQERPSYSPGLEGVIAGTSAICYLNHETGEIMYRGYSLRDLAENATYEEVVYLLLFGKLPNSHEFDEFTSRLVVERSVPDKVEGILRQLPKNSHPMDILRTGTSLLGLYDAKPKDSSREANLERAIRLIARMPILLTHYYRYANSLLRIRSEKSFGHSENFLHMLLGKKPDEFWVKTFNVSLVLYAEHELNASTFSAIVTAATLTDIFSGVTAAIGTLKGPLHGGANEAVAKMLIDIGDVSRAEKYVKDTLARRERVMGFGHRIHRGSEDPRSAIIKRYAKELGERTGETKWYDICSVMEAVMRKERNLYPNLELYTAVAYVLMGIPMTLYTPIFVCSRLAGWTAHVIEQQENNRIIRPRSIYTGLMNLQYVPVEKRP